MPLQNQVLLPFSFGTALVNGLRAGSSGNSCLSFSKEQEVSIFEVTQVSELFLVWMVVLSVYNFSLRLIVQMKMKISNSVVLILDRISCNTLFSACYFSYISKLTGPKVLKISLA